METSSAPLLIARPESDTIAPRIELRCACGECRLPFAYFEAGMLVIVSWHNHQKHINKIPLQMVIMPVPQQTGGM